MQGYCGDHPQIAHLERYLDSKGKLRQFQEAFNKATGSHYGPGNESGGTYLFCWMVTVFKDGGVLAGADLTRPRLALAWQNLGTPSLGLTLPGTVTIRTADGSLGDPAGAPWDGIIVTAAAPSIPNELRDQLADGGRLVIPVGPRDHQVLTLVVRRGDDWHETPHGAVVFVPLIGQGGFPDEPPRRDDGWRRWF